MGVTDQKTLLKIRTFASDRRRIEGVETETEKPAEQQGPQPHVEVELPHVASPKKTKHIVTIERRNRGNEEQPEQKTPEPERTVLEPHVPYVTPTIAATVSEEKKHTPEHKIPSFHELQKKSDRTISVTAAPEKTKGKKGVRPRRDHSFTSTTTIITDNKKSGEGFFTRVAHSLYNWGISFKKQFSKKKTPKYTVQDTVIRKGVIQKATTKSGAIFTADNESLKEQIRRRQSHVSSEQVHIDWSPNTEPGFALLESPELGESERVMNVQVQFKKRVVPEEKVVERTSEWESSTSDAAPVIFEKETRSKTVPVSKESASTIPPITIVAPSESIDLPELPVIEEPTVEEETKVDAPVYEVPEISTPTKQKERQSPLDFLRRRDALYQTDTNRLALGIVSFVALFALVAIGAKLLFGVFTQTPTGSVLASKTEPIISKADVIEVPVLTLSNEGITAAIEQSDAIVPSNFTEIVFTDQTGTPLTPHQIIELLQLQVPSSLHSETVSLRVLSIDKQKRGLVFTVTNNTVAFGSLLFWEKTIGTDLKGTVIATPLSSSTVFIDRTIYETDVRILMNNGSERLAYGFIDEHTFVITPDTESFTRVLIEQF